MQELEDHDRSSNTAFRLGHLPVNVRQFVLLSVCLRVCHDFLRHSQMGLRNLKQLE
jgi:hypothetical protein